jgi:uncharacterized protein (DUF2141 family)
MLKKLVPLFLCLVLAFSAADAGENYTISGDVTFQNDGDIYICLYTKEGWQNFQTPGHELSSSNCKHEKMNSDLKKAGKVSFKFENVPKGVYSVIAYLDANENGKVDFTGNTMIEPWGTYKDYPPEVPHPTWSTIKFEIDKDITGVTIHM